MLKRNQPEPAGYALGANLARFADDAEARLKADGYEVPERCSTCAFRVGTVPNGCITSVMDATKCMIEHVPFLCHHDKAHKTPCAGFLAIMANGGPDSQPGIAPWPFSDEAARPAPTSNRSEKVGQP
jgi:hypothetical protein